MNKKMSLTLIAIGLGMSLSNMAAAQEKLIVYTSMKESLIGALKAKFTEKHPDVEMDYQSAGAGKLMAKIATEKESGKIMADVIWTSEVPDFFQMKKNGMLEAYVSPETANIVNPIPNFDGSFTPIRLGTLAIAYNTRFVKDNPPAEWADILKPEYKGAAILKGTEHLAASQKFIDFLLSEDGQKIIANEGTLPVRKGIELDAKFGMPSLEDAVSRAIPIDYEKLMSEKEETIKHFTQILQGR